MKICNNENPVLPKQSKYESSYVWLAKDRVIFLKEGITKEVAAEVIALLLYYDHESHEDITIYIHSTGGEADGLSSIYDVMHMIKSPVSTVCLGKAYSAAAILLSAGSKGKRYALKNSKIMIHGIQFVFPIPGDDQVNSKNYFDFVKSNNDNLMKILANGTNHPLSKVKEDCKRDLFLDAKEALAYGIIDKVI
jgi:ATP-dependent Clp protease protease subunit